MAFASCFQKSKGMSVYANITDQKLHEYHVLADEDTDADKEDEDAETKHNERAKVEAEMLQVK